jgi:predicted TIM-barrel fold metal-dependent hydrolase
VDHHVHGVVDLPLDRPAFELLMNEGGMAAPPGLTHFDSPVGLAVRMRCAPVLGLDPGCDPDEYLRARADLGVDEVNRRFLRASGLAAMFVETGHRGSEVVTPQAMARLAARPAYEVTRIERVAEEVAEQVDSPGHWADAVGTALADAATKSIGFKTIVGYRYGFDLDVAVPTRDEVARAADAWFRNPSARLDSPVLLRHVLHTAVDAAATARIPLQAHTGFGDTDLTLHRVDPSVFTPWVRELGARRVQLIFLHCYPYQRQAGYLAAVFPHVSFDVGCMFHYLGASSTRTLAEALELASWTKLLYSSDAFGLAEFAYLGSVLFRRALDTVLRGWVDADDCTDEIADQIRVAVCAGNASRLYRLDEQAHLEETP